MIPPDGVKAERTGWRDTSLSARHRFWGFDCPFVDIDWWVIEYNSGLPVLIVDYKSWRAPWPPEQDSNAKALGSLLMPDSQPIPMVWVRYRRDPWAFLVLPGNARARYLWPTWKDGYLMTERAYVRWMYEARSRPLPLRVAERLSQELPRGWAEGVQVAA